MPFRTPWTNFTGGEFTPLLRGRMDLKAYYNSAQMIRNGIVKPYGGVGKLPGTRFIYEQKNETQPALIYTAKCSSQSIYRLCFEGQRWLGPVESGGYLRIFADQGIIVTSGTTPLEVETPYKTADLANLRFRQDRDVIYIFHEDYQPRKLIRHAHNNWTIEEVVFRNGPYKPKNEEQMSQVAYSGRSGSVTLTSRRDMFTGMVGKKLRILDGEAKITAVTNARSATADITEEISDKEHDGGLGKEILSGTWTVNSGTLTTNTATSVAGTGPFEIQKTFNLYYGDEYLLAMELVGAAIASGKSVQVSMSTDDFNPSTNALMGGAYIETPLDISRIAAGDFCINMDMGDYQHGQLPYESTHNSYPPDPDKMQGTLKIKWNGGASDTLTINAITFREKGPAHSWACVNWAWEALNSTNGYPFCGHIFERRMWLYGNREFPHGMWASQTDDFENFDAYDPELDTSGMFLLLDTGPQVENIKWATSRADMWVGTDFGVWRIKSSEAGKPLSPSGIKSVPESAFGSDDEEALYIDTVIVFLERSRRSLREMSYSLESDSWDTDELTLYAEHVLNDSKAGGMAWQQRPFGVLWVVRDDGTIATCTYLKKQKVNAWAVQDIGGVVESITAGPGQDGKDEVWVTVKRTINGQTRRYVEMFEPEGRKPLEWRNSFCSLTYSGTPVTQVSGLTHLAGMPVRIVADGVLLKRQTVSAGGIVALEGEDGTVTASQVVVGLTNRSIVHTQNLEHEMPTGTIQGQNIKLAKVIAKLAETGYGMAVATDVNYSNEAAWEWVNFRTPSDPMDAPVPPYTGDKTVIAPTTYSPESSLYIIHDEPTGFHLQGLVIEWQEGS